MSNTAVLVIAFLFFIALMVYWFVTTAAINKRIDQNLDELQCLSNNHEIRMVKGSYAQCHCGLRRRKSLRS